MWFRPRWPCAYFGGFGACVEELVMCSIAVRDDVEPPGVNMPGNPLQVLVAKFRRPVAYLTQQVRNFLSWVAASLL